MSLEIKKTFCIQIPNYIHYLHNIRLMWFENYDLHSLHESEHYIDFHYYNLWIFPT